MPRVQNIWTWVPIQESHARINTKQGFRFKHFDQRETLFQEHIENRFLFPKPISNNACHAKQIRSCNAARYSARTIKGDQDSNLKTRI